MPNERACSICEKPGHNVRTCPLAAGHGCPNCIVGLGENAPPCALAHPLKACPLPCVCGGDHPPRLCVALRAQAPCRKRKCKEGKCGNRRWKAPATLTCAGVSPVAGGDLHRAVADGAAAAPADACAAALFLWEQSGAGEGEAARKAVEFARVAAGKGSEPCARLLLDAHRRGRGGVTPSDLRSLLPLHPLSTNIGKECGEALENAEPDGPEAVARFQGLFDRLTADPRQRTSKNLLRLGTWCEEGRGRQKSLSGAAALLLEAYTVAKSDIDGIPESEWDPRSAHVHGLATDINKSWKALLRVAAALEREGAAGGLEGAEEIYRTVAPWTVDAKYHLARLREKGVAGGSPDEALALYMEAARGRNAVAAAQVRLGSCHEDGSLGLVPDLQKALAWFRMAAERGGSDAMTAYAGFWGRREKGWTSASGRAGELKEMLLLRDAQEFVKGGLSLDLCVRLGGYIDSLGPGNPEARDHYEQAAALGHVEAHEWLVAYHEGAHDPRAAATWRARLGEARRTPGQVPGWRRAVIEARRAAEERNAAAKRADEEENAAARKARDREAIARFEALVRKGAAASAVTAPALSWCTEGGLRALRDESGPLPPSRALLQHALACPGACACVRREEEREEQKMKKRKRDPTSDAGTDAPDPKRAKDMGAQQAAVTPRSRWVQVDELTRGAQSMVEMARRVAARLSATGLVVDPPITPEGTRAGLKKRFPNASTDGRSINALMALQCLMLVEEYKGASGDEPSRVRNAFEEDGTFALADGRELLFGETSVEEATAVLEEIGRRVPVHSKFPTRCDVPDCRSKTVFTYENRSHLARHKREVHGGQKRKAKTEVANTQME